MELFAGVGGFRLGLEGFSQSAHLKNPAFKVVWSNQWEPSTKRQHASEVYTTRWGHAGHSNEDIFDVIADRDKFDAVIDARPDVLVGGFPCQDYSVAKPAEMAAGIEGKKGVLWWAIHRSLRQLADAGQPVKYLVLENVDRLLKSPTANRGRDMAVILASLSELDYAVEWRVVNAAEQGFPQRRKRVFLVGYHSSTSGYVDARKAALNGEAGRWLTDEGVLAVAFGADPVDAVRENGTETPVQSFSIGRSPLDAQATYVAGSQGTSRFLRAGLMVDGVAWTGDLATKARGESIVPGSVARTLGDVVGKTLSVPASFFIDDEDVSQWRYLKGAKAFLRTSASGHTYRYSEGSMTFPDSLSRPSRTIITAEGGRTPSRFKHVVETSNGRLRRLLPEELEDLNGFPRGFTAVEGLSDTKRAFLMGNALVVGLVNAIAGALACRHHSPSAFRAFASKRSNLRVRS